MLEPVELWYWGWPNSAMGVFGAKFAWPLSRKPQPVQNGVAAPVMWARPAVVVNLLSAAPQRVSDPLQEPPEGVAPFQLPPHVYVSMLHTAPEGVSPSAQSA